MDEEKNNRREFYENLAKGINEQNIVFEGEKDIMSQIESLEKEAIDQTDIRKKLEIRRKIIGMRAELEIKKIKIANKSVKKHVLGIIRESAIKQGAFNKEES